MKKFILWLVASLTFLILAGLGLGKLGDLDYSNAVLFFFGLVYCAIGAAFLIKTMTEYSKYLGETKYK